MGRGVAVSLAIHICIVLPIVIWILSTPSARRRNPNRLNVSVVGVITNRQTPAQRQRIPIALPKRAEPIQKLNDTKPAVVPKAPTLIDPHTRQIEPSTNTSEPLPVPQVSSIQHEDSNEEKARPQTGTEAQQPQQTIAVHNDMSDRITAYMAQLTKRLQSNLIYPQEAKKKKIEGTSLVSFVITESGEIQPNTLAVKRSSGNASLDASALHTVASSAPFQRPPRELNVSIELEFEVDSKIF